VNKKILFSVLIVLLLTMNCVFASIYKEDNQAFGTVFFDTDSLKIGTVINTPEKEQVQALSLNVIIIPNERLRSQAEKIHNMTDFDMIGFETNYLFNHTTEVLYYNQSRTFYFRNGEVVKIFTNQSKWEVADKNTTANWFLSRALYYKTKAK